MRERSSKYDPKSQMQVTFIHLASIDYRPNNNSNNLIITAKTDKLFLQLGWFMNLMLNKIILLFIPLSKPSLGTYSYGLDAFRSYDPFQSS